MPNTGFVTFEIDEADKEWATLRAWIARHRAVDVPVTTFSEAELSQALWLEMMPAWHHGYPQPNEDQFGYRPYTYDLGDWCDRCGIGLRQKAPFRMKGEPKWGKNGILQLNWIHEEFFVTPAVWSSVFEPFGIGGRPVTDSDGRDLTSVLQLVIEDEALVDPAGLSFDECSKCRRLKYLPSTRGPFPPLAEEPQRPIARTRQYFGSGAQAARPVVVSRALAQEIVAGVRGVSLRPSGPLDRLNHRS